LAAIFNINDVIVCWSYPSGEILFKKKLNERVHEIDWNPFRPNVFAAYTKKISCFFISNLFTSVRYTSCDLLFLQNIRPNILDMRFFLPPPSWSQPVTKSYPPSFYYVTKCSTPLPLFFENKKRVKAFAFVTKNQFLP
jgi:hypothetical protein